MSSLRTSSLARFFLPRVIHRSDAAQCDQRADGRGADSQQRQHQLRRLFHFSSGNADGQIYAFLSFMLAAAEAAVGLAIVLAIFQLFHTIDVEAAETLKE
jgi:hypothetical protein